MTGSETLEPGTRALRPAERRLLSVKARELRSRASAAPRAVRVGVVGTAILWLLTLLASEDPWLVITAVWIVVGSGLVLWLRWDARKDAARLRAMAGTAESALEADRAEVYDVRARAFAELEEYEDEGPCYAFDLGDGRIVIVVGQRFYPEARFPSLDFSLVHPLDGEGAAVDEWIEKRGPRAEPDRVIPADVKWEMEIPEHLSVVRVSLDRLEEILRRRGSRA
ncbi:MAG TPA: hypothetical protein VLL48_01145 [Longimicrobiales bacterium]|nr:hypothetical protein [Longimicrobiales bacterium]